MSPHSSDTRARRRELETRGGYLWRDRATAMAHGLGFADARPRPCAGHVLRRPADARLAGPRTGHRRRRAAARRAHQPSGHRVAGVARADARRAGRGSRARRARPLVPGDGRHRGAGAGGRARRASSPAAGTPGAREQAAREIALGKAIDKPAGRDRAAWNGSSSASRQGDEGAPGAVAREAAREDRAHRAGGWADGKRRSSSRSSAPERAGRRRCSS